MTEKLYYISSAIYTFESPVVSVTVRDGRMAVVLERTAFFPTGGGQPYDEGTLNGFPVDEVLEEDGEIFHYFRKPVPLAEGETVCGVIDRELRIARMQAHSGEHIVSGTAHTLYGVENVGFHMDGLLMTVDFDKPLTKEDIDRIEWEANRRIYEDLPIHAEIFSPEEAGNIEYRSKKEFESDIRIVTIEGVDRCACCAPHVSRTGEVGLIKILSCISHRGGVRITLICGSEALADYRVKYDNTLRTAALMAVKHNEIFEGVQMLYSQINELKSALAAEREKFCAAVVDSRENTEGNSVVFGEELSLEEMRSISLGMLGKCGGMSVVCSGNDGKGYSYVITRRNTVMNRYAKEINAALAGRGGGRDEMIQGSFKAARTDIENFFKDYTVNES